MSYSNGKISAPVSIYDVQRAIGNTSNDLGTLCQAQNINMWAKYKPVQLFDTIETTDQWDFNQNKWKSNANWWRGLPNQIGGITVPAYVSTVNQVIALYDGGANGWIYNKPAGNIHPFRLTDFAQYNHLAPKAIENFYVPDSVISDGHFFASAIMSMPAADADYLTLIDMTSDAFTHIYFGVAIVDSGGNLVRRCTSDIEGEAGVYVDLSSRQLSPNAYYLVYPFFCNTAIPITSPVDPSGIRCLPCPYLSPLQIRAINRNDYADISVAAEYDRNDSTKINITIMNGDSRAYLNSYIYVMPMSYWSNPGPNVGYAVKSYTDFTLPQQSSAFTYTFSSVPSGEYFIYATFSNGTYWRKTNILEPYEPQI